MIKKGSPVAVVLGPGEGLQVERPAAVVGCTCGLFMCLLYPLAPGTGLGVG